MTYMQERHTPSSNIRSVSKFSLRFYFHHTRKRPKMRRAVKKYEFQVAFMAKVKYKINKREKLNIKIA